MADLKYRALHTAKANDVKGTIKKTVSYITDRHKAAFIVTIVCLVLSSLAGVASSYFFTPIINKYVVPNIGVENPDLSGFVKMLILMGGIYLAGAISSFVYKKLISIISTGMLHDLRVDLFRKMETLPIMYFKQHTHGEVMVLYTNDIDIMRPMISETLPSLFNTAITLIGCFTMMAILNFKLMLIVLGMLIIMMIVTFSLGKNSRKYFKDLQVQVSNINGYIEEMFSGQKVIKVFTHEKKSIEGFNEINKDLYSASVRTNAFASILMPVNQNLSYISYAVVAVVGAYMYINGDITIGVLASFLMFVRQFAGPVSNLSQQFNGFMMSLAGAERVFDLMETDSEIDEGKVTLVNVKEGIEELEEVSYKTNRWAWKDGDKLIELKGHVVFDDVTFAYEDDPERDILKHITIDALPGQKVAFVGSTGAGKTTITNLLNRFHDIKSGTITYDGIPIRNIKKGDLRRSIGMVLQDTNLFSGTVLDNIRYGNLDATDEECIAAAKRCSANSFIEMLPDGYNTVLTANGSNLSQGQRQLLNIARCAVANPPVMVLDEATSSIDTHTEKLIEQGMDELMKDRTTFVIAHRLSTVRNSNIIVVIEHGVIQEMGTHDELIEKKGRYYQLYTGKVELD